MDDFQDLWKTGRTGGLINFEDGCLKNWHYSKIGLNKKRSSCNLMQFTGFISRQPGYRSP